MTKKFRTILFLASVLLFLISAPAAVLYSQGYRIDIAERKLAKTGGIFLKITPKQSDISINGKFEKKTDFFFGTTLIKNLLPEIYNIRAEKEGYFPWEKNLEVLPKMVTEAKSIVLFPKNPVFTTLASGAENFWFSPDGRKVIIKEKDENGWTLKLYDLEKQLKSHLINEKDIDKKGADLISLEFGENLPEVYLSTIAKEQIKSFILKFEENPPQLSSKKTATTSDSIIAYQKSYNDTYFLDNLGNLYKSDSLFIPKEKINNIPFPLQQETEYKLKIFLDKFFIQENQVLYTINEENKFFEKFFEPIKDLNLSPDSKKIAYFSDSEIWILFLEESNEQPKRKTGEKIFLTGFPEKIGNIFWLNSDYLILNTGNKIKIAEIDDRDEINIYDLGEYENPDIFFNSADKKLYILSESTLYATSPILP